MRVVIRHKIPMDSGIRSIVENSKVFFVKKLFILAGQRVDGVIPHQLDFTPNVERKQQ
jgi:hypothetical protein